MPTARLGDRRLFPDLEAPYYLNHAAISPPSIPVRQAAASALEDYARRGAGAFVTYLEQRQRLKGKLARLIGARAEDVALSPNTTRGVIDVALCFPWEKGDRVVCFDGEFPANVTPWQRAAELFGLEVVMVSLSAFAEGSGAGLAALDRALEPRARLVAVSAVEFQSGLRMPLEAIAARAHARGAQLFVDGVQAVGATPIDVVKMGVDYLAAGSHKWLMGPEGGGLLYVSPERVSALKPNVAGWLSHEEPVDFLMRGGGLLRYDKPIRRRADLVEGGNCNTAGLVGLEAAVDLIEQIGVPAIFAHALAYDDALEAGLVARGFTSRRSKETALRSAILSVSPPAGLSVIDLQRLLGNRGVACSTPDGLLRFAPHWPNHLNEIHGVLAAVDGALGELRR